VWEIVASVFAMQEDEYTVRVPTLADSSASGTEWSVNLVTTHTTTPSVWFVSDPDSGYSVDNIAPAPPTGLTFSTPSVLSWDPAPEEDFAYHTIYGSEVDTLNGSATVLAYTTDTSHDVSSTPSTYYHVTTSDHAGNESEEATAGAATSVPPLETPVVAYSLHACSPNPFRERTTLRFDLPVEGSVRLVVFDVEGRAVRTLADGFWPAGRHHVHWKGIDQGGRPASPGIYFVRMEAGGFTDTNTVLLIR
jgi:hypothetical protein